MKISRLLLATLISIVCVSVTSCDFELLCEPEGYELTEQSGHLTYYFPTREELGVLADGTYAGKILCGFQDIARVQINVEDNTVIDCVIKYLVMSKYIYDLGLDDVAREEAPERFLDAQSPRFDAITGATGSTHAFKICVTRVVESSGGGRSHDRVHAPSMPVEHHMRADGTDTVNIKEYVAFVGAQEVTFVVECQILCSAREPFMISPSPDRISFVPGSGLRRMQPICSTPMKMIITPAISFHF